MSSAKKLSGELAITKRIDKLAATALQRVRDLIAEGYTLASASSTAIALLFEEADGQLVWTDADRAAYAAISSIAWAFGINGEPSLLPPRFHPELCTRADLEVLDQVEPVSRSRVIFYCRARVWRCRQEGMSDEAICEHLLGLSWDAGISSSLQTGNPAEREAIVAFTRLLLSQYLPLKESIRETC